MNGNTCSSFTHRVARWSILLGLAVMFAWAQSTSTGTVSGQVTDQSNAAIPGAEVRLIYIETNAVRTAATNETGRYIFVNVEPGVYDLTVSKQGFSQAKLAAQSV